MFGSTYGLLRDAFAGDDLPNIGSAAMSNNASTMFWRTYSLLSWSRRRSFRRALLGCAHSMLSDQLAAVFGRTHCLLCDAIAGHYLSDFGSGTLWNFASTVFRRSYSVLYFVTAVLRRLHRLLRIGDFAQRALLKTRPAM